MLRYLTAGESHGKTLLAVIEGFPAGMKVLTEPIDVELRRRQGGYGRGGRQKLDLEKLELSDPNDSEFLTALDRELTELAAEKPEAAEVVNLRFFAGLSIEQTAAAMNLSVRTVNRHWAFARAWLFERLSEDQETQADPEANEGRAAQN